MCAQKTTKKIGAATRSLIKEQLLPEFNFIGYCNTDDANKYTSGAKFIDAQFVRAARDEGLLMPLYSAEGPARQPDGSVQDGIVDYYSPLQLYIVTQLRKNIVLNGRLWDPGSVESYPDKPVEERPRYIAWGSGMAFLVRDADDPARKKSDDVLFNPYLLTATFDAFLRFIHTTPLKDKYKMPMDESDIFESVATFDHDLTAIVSLLDELKQYRLDAKKLNFLRTHVAQAAAIIDPLELWYYYIDRHPSPKKSLLKGDARVAQKLYKIYNLITDVWQRVTGEESKPLLELVAGEIGSGYLTPRTEYLHGTDVQAMKQSIDGFNTWSRIRGNGKYVTKQIREALAKTVTGLDDYENRYGDRSYGGSYRTREDHGVRYDQLDEISKKHFDQWRLQTHDEEEWATIEDVISYRLSDIQRSLSTVYRDVSEQHRAITSEAWDMPKHFNHTFWMQHPVLSQEERMKVFQKESKRLTAHARACQEKEREFWGAVSSTRLAFCKICRKRPIQLHTDSNRRGFESQPTICDECVREKKELPDNTKDAEWKCPHCHAVICKFVHSNTLSGRMLNKAPFIIELTYGSLTIRAKCPKCNEDLDRQVEWGWLP